MPSAAVLAAILGSSAIAAVKFTAAALSGSAGLLAEGIHSVVDAGNSCLLYVGQRRSRKPPDDHHPFGYGMELYFWSLVVALVMFVIGGAVTIIEGIARLAAPEELEAPLWSYGALGISVLFNGYTWFAAWREFRAGQKDKALGQALRHAKDPTTLTVLFEDSASLVGLAIALVGVILAQLLGSSVPDGIASVAIGIIMACVALGLIYQCKTLLVGESANAELEDAIRRIVERNESVERIEDLLTMHFSPREVLTTMIVRFPKNAPANDIAQAIDQIRTALRSDHPEIKRVFIQPAA